MGTLRSRRCDLGQYHPHDTMDAGQFSAAWGRPVTESAFRCGVYLPPFGPCGDPAVLVDLAVRAEVAGWDGVFLWDHLAHEVMPIVDPWTALGAIAHATHRALGPHRHSLPSRRRHRLITLRGALCTSGAARQRSRSSR